MNGYTPAQLRSTMALGEAIAIAAVEIARATQRHFRPAPRPRGATLRPGSATPLWAALVTAVRPHLRRRGAKSNLPRELGLDPSRVTEFFVRRSAMPDAERTLLLIEWLGRRSRRW